MLRAEVGQVYEICDNEDVYVAEIETTRKSVVVFRCKEKLAAPEAKRLSCWSPPSSSSTGLNG